MNGGGGGNDVIGYMGYQREEGCAKIFLSHYASIRLRICPHLTLYNGKLFVLGDMSWDSALRGNDPGPAHPGGNDCFIVVRVKGLLLSG